jgi:hypothetical protein
VHLKYASVASPSAANFGADVVAVLTGETNKANLSADCSQTNTSIVDTVHPAGWTVWDSATGTSDEWVLRAPCDGDASKYKYLRMRFYISSGYMRIDTRLMEGWNTSTNAATNSCSVTNMTHVGPRIPITTYGDFIQAMDVMSSEHYIFFRDTGYSATNGRSYMMPCLELDRIHPCLAVGSGYLPAVQVELSWDAATSITSYQGQMCRVIDDAGTADIQPLDVRVLSTLVRPSNLRSSEFDNADIIASYDDSSVASYELYAFLVERRDLVAGIIGISDLAEVYYWQAGTLSGFEDDTTHELDAANDLRLSGLHWDQVAATGSGRILFRNDV